MSQFVFSCRCFGLELGHFGAFLATPGSYRRPPPEYSKHVLVPTARLALQGPSVAVRGRHSGTWSLGFTAACMALVSQAVLRVHRHVVPWGD